MTGHQERRAKLLGGGACAGLPARQGDVCSAVSGEGEGWQAPDMQTDNTAEGTSGCLSLFLLTQPDHWAAFGC